MTKSMLQVTLPLRGKTEYLELRFDDSKDDWSIWLSKRGKKGVVLIGYVSKHDIKRLAKAS